MSPDSTNVPPAVQDRSKRTLERIYLAGTEVLETQGPSALTIAAVAAAAGVSTGSIYRRFGSKEQLLMVIQNEFVEDFKEELARRLAVEHLLPDASLHSAVRVAVDGFVATFEPRRRLLRELMLVSLENSAVQDVGSAGAIECGVMFRNLLMRVSSQIAREDPEAAVDFAYRMLYAMCAFRAAFGENVESTRPTPWTALIDESTAAVYAYLSTTD
ncbi:TetR/AcrR family transcriptional regulator [Actinomycetes bacterium M1A6_2h]